MTADEQPPMVRMIFSMEVRRNAQGKVIGAECVQRVVDVKPGEVDFAGPPPERTGEPEQAV
jgi:hypothetical protein